MLIKTPNSIIMLFILAVILAIPVRTHAATAPQQTILNPAAPRKSDYPKIVIYTVSWCPHCRELKEYLTSRNIPFVNRDVELEPAAMDELTQKYKTFGVPLIIIGNDQEVVRGFTVELFENAVEKVRSGKKP
jgi:glutaredoxin-like YruB-family protein